MADSRTEGSAADMVIAGRLANESAAANSNSGSGVDTPATAAVATKPQRGTALEERMETRAAHAASMSSRAPSASEEGAEPEWWCDDQNRCRRCAEYTGDVTAAIDGRHPAQCLAESRRKDKLGALTRRRRSEGASRRVGRK